MGMTGGTDVVELNYRRNGVIGRHYRVQVTREGYYYVNFGRKIGEN